MGLIVMCIADAGKRVSLTGGPYAYVGTAFGPYAGFLSGVLLWMLGTFATAAVSTVFASSLGLLVPALSGWACETAILVVGVCVLVGGQPARRDARRAAQHDRHRRQAVAVVAGRGRPARSSSAPRTSRSRRCPPAGDIARTSLLLIFAFAGIEIAR